MQLAAPRHAGRLEGSGVSTRSDKARYKGADFLSGPASNSCRVDRETFVLRPRACTRSDLHRRRIQPVPDVVVYAGSPFAGEILHAGEAQQSAITGHVGTPEVFVEHVSSFV